MTFLRSMLFILFCLVIPTHAYSQVKLPPSKVPSAPVTLAELQALSLLSDDAQRTLASQEVLQRWYMWMVDAYLDQFKGTELGRSKNFALGQRNMMTRLLLPPSGNGNVAVLISGATGFARVSNWWYGTTMAPQKQDGGDIRYPRDAIASYWNPYAGAGDASTAWHELTHGTLGAGTVTATVADWAPYLPMGGDTDEHHVYIEALVGRTVDWLKELLITYQFEDKIREAWLKEKEYKERKEEIDYFRERAIWATCHAIWCDSFPKAKKIAPLPDGLREECKKLTGIDLPTPEAVIKFYMDGNVKVGTTAIKVPEWVLSDKTIPSLVIIQDEKHQPASSLDTKGCHTFSVLVKERYKLRRPITRGMLDFSLYPADPGVSLLVSNGKNVLPVTATTKKLAKTSVTINLETIENDLKKIENDFFQITFTHAKPKEIYGKKNYTIQVSYMGFKDASGKIYDSSEALFFIDINGKKAPPKTAKKSINNSISKPKTKPVTKNASNSPSKQSGSCWVLTKTEVNDRVENKNSVIDHSFGENTFSATTKFENDKLTQNGSWTVPPSRLIPGSHIKIILSSTTGSTQAMCFGTDYALVKGGMPDSQIGIVKDETKTFDFEVPKALSNESYVYLAIGIGSNTYDSSVVAYRAYRYNWQRVEDKPAPVKPITPAVKEEITSSVTRKHSLEQVDDPVLDNIPPGPGELFSPKDEKLVIEKMEPPKESQPPAKPKLKTQEWYTHPSNVYRIKLPTGWGAVYSYPVSSMDCLAPSDYNLAVLCDRFAPSIGSMTEKTAIDAVVAGVKRLHPDAFSESFNIPAGIQVTGISWYENKLKRMQWVIVFIHNKSIYTISMIPPPESGKQGFPELTEEMLDSLRILDKSP